MINRLSYYFKYFYLEVRIWIHKAIVFYRLNYEILDDYFIIIFTIFFYFLEKISNTRRFAFFEIYEDYFLSILLIFLYNIFYFFKIFAFLYNLFFLFVSNAFIIVYFDLFFLLTFVFLYFCIFVFYKKKLYKLVEVDTEYFYKNKEKYTFYIIFNFLLFIIFFVFYKVYLFNNNFNNSIFIFYKKLKIFNINLVYTFNLDYINFYFIFLTIFIFFIIYFTFFNLKFKNDIDLKNIKIVLFLFLLIEILLILTFSTSNLFFFFIFFEISLMPLYFLILILGKGGKKKHFAAFALIFYTLFGSIFLLFGIIYLNIISNTLDFKDLSFEIIDFNSQLWLFFLFFVGFSVKVPIFPFYSWLPEAHVEASTSLSILLASIFLKIATYAFLKIVIFNFYEANIFFYKFVMFFSLVSILLASFISITVNDLKKIVALSSIIHMNYIIIALFSLKTKLIFASLLYMFSHAFISSGLFYMIGILYENNSTRNLNNFSKSLNYNSKFFFFFFFFNLSNISFPLTIAFVAELIILNNLASLSIILLIIILISTLFSTMYTFLIIHNVLFGKFFLKKNFYFLTKLDFFFLFILFLIIIILGIFTNACMYNLEQEIYLILQKKIDTF